MKNKKLTYFVLFPAVIIIWGVVVYKIIAKDQHGAMKHSIPVPVSKEDKITGNKGYQLLINYPDPFIPGKKTVPAKKRENPIAGPKHHWPNIRFNGYVLNGNTTKAHVTIDGKNMILSVHEKFSDGCILTRITRDSIRIKYKNDIKWFRQQP